MWNKSLLIVLVLSLVCLAAQAQRHRILDPNIRTLTVEAGEDGGSLPIITLDGDDALLIGFDEMTHEFSRFLYRIEHLDCDFQPTADLFESEYVQSAAEEEVIEDFEPSYGVVTNYTHYSLTFPNERMQPLVSGNYRLTIRRDEDDDEDHPVAVVYFGVIDEKTSIALEATTNTDIDFQNAHQQLAMAVDLGNLLVRNPLAEVKTIVLQNRRWDNAVLNPEPTSIRDGMLVWSHCDDLIFSAGNEYHSFEMLSTRYPGMHLETLRWQPSLNAYRAELFPDQAARNYLRIDDRNGQFVCNCDDGDDPDVQSEYAYVHFTLQADEVPDADVFIDGWWTHNRFTRENRMDYNAATGAYEADLYLKLGYYNYQYLTLPRQNPIPAQTSPLQGDFYQTENEYTVLVYYRRQGDRYWQLVGGTCQSYRPR